MYQDVGNQWQVGVDYAPSGGVYPGRGDTAGLMATSPGIGGTEAWTTGGEVGPDDGYGGAYAGGAGQQGDYGGGGSDYAYGDVYGGGGDGGGGGSSLRPSKSGGAPVATIGGGNILVGFAVTAGAFVLGAWGLHHVASGPERELKHLSPSFVNAMEVGAMGVLTIPLWRALFAQLAHWGVPFMGDVSAYVNGA